MFWKEESVEKLKKVLKISLRRSMGMMFINIGFMSQISM